jgi:hypothetical protein
MHMEDLIELKRTLKLHHNQHGLWKLPLECTKGDKLALFWRSQWLYTQCISPFPLQTQFPLFSPCTKASSRCLSWNPSQNLHCSAVFDLIQGVALTLSTMNLNLQPRWWTTSSISTKVHDSCFYIWFTMHIQSRSIWIKECGFDIGLCTQTRDCTIP